LAEKQLGDNFGIESSRQSYLASLKVVKVGWATAVCCPRHWMV